MDQLVTVLFTDEYFQRTEESVSNVAEIMEIKAWINRKIDISDCIRLYGASDKLFHLRSNCLEKKEDPQERVSSSRTMFRNQRGSVTNDKKIVLERPLLVVWILTESACYLGGGRTCQCPPVQTP
ncbi:hypothetical protein TNCV_3869011 [Trichonephila clavipes]|nr:hypothetical protein TNCV_3869011 [Trichonephila clavipes]